jgi:uncharacterized protein YwgA
MGKGEVRWLIRLLGIGPKELIKTTSFNKRLRVQKAVLLLNHLGVSPFTNYAFNLYLRGPYSSSLAADYYKLGKINAKRVRLDENSMKTLKWFTSKDETWLEVASSILSLRERYGAVMDGEIYSTLRMSKPWVDEPMYKGVTADLAEHGLLSR